jgi:hypothetical protein
LQEPRGAPESAHIVDDRLHRLSDIRLRYGSITIGTLRLLYGSFAPHCADSEKLGAVLEKLDEASLGQLLQDLKSGKLATTYQGIASPALKGWSIRMTKTAPRHFMWGETGVGLGVTVVVWPS